MKKRTQDLHLTFLNKRMSFKGLFYLMEAFGLFMGLIFPAFVFPFVNFKSVISFIIFWICCIAAGLFVGYLCYHLTKITSTQLLLEATKKAESSLGLELSSSSEINEEFEVAKEKFFTLVNITNSLMDKIRKISSELERASENVAKASTQNASSSTELASSISQISATIEEILKTSQQITSSMQQVLENAEKTVQAVLSGKKEIEDSYQFIKESTEVNYSLINKLSELTEKISAIRDVLRFIEDIADQTKILSLNASIEAARAGEAGKGFSVVAGEIRNLAENVISYTSTIKESIGEASELFEKIKQLSDSNKKMIELVNQKSTITTNQLEVIEKAASETKFSANTILIALEQEKEATSQIASAIKQVHASSKELVSVANLLNKVATEMEERARELNQSLKNLNANRAIS